MSSRFIVMSNSRTGSTWLTTALNQVEDITTDFEIKIPPIAYPKLPNHFLMQGSFDEEFWPLVPSNLVRGSKLVLDPKPHDQSLLSTLKLHIPSDVKIVFLTRCLAEQTISKMKVGHKNRLKSGLTYQSNRISDRLLEESQALDHMPNREISLNLDSIRLFTSAVNIRLANDLLIRKYLGESEQAFVHIDYSNLKEKFTNLCAFLGSEIKNLPPIDKLAITEKVNRTESTVDTVLKAFAARANELREEIFKIDDVNFDVVRSFYNSSSGF